MIRDLQQHLRVLDIRIGEFDLELKRLASANEDARRLQTIPGIEPISASAVVATVGSAAEFRNGRQLAAWLGERAAFMVTRARDCAHHQHALRREEAPRDLPFGAQAGAQSQ